MGTKSEELTKWRALDNGQNPLQHMQPIPYKSEGSSYGACGVRIDGSPEFIDAVLSNLKPLLAGENQVTRLELARRPVASKNPISGKAFTKTAVNAEVCYVRLHVRGREGAMVQGIMRQNVDATGEFERVNRFAQA